MGGLLRDGFLLSAGELGVELVGNGVGYLAFHSKDIVEFAVVAFRPKMLGRCSANQLDVHVHSVSDFLHTAFEKIRHAQLLADLTQVLGRALVFLSRSARDDLERGNLREPGQDFVLDTVGKVSIRSIVAEILERQDGDAFFRDRRRRSAASRCVSGSCRRKVWPRQG